MMTFYQRRGTGKSTNLVLQSHLSGLPIAACSQQHANHLQWIADERLHITIPKPFIASAESCTKVGRYIIDEAGAILQKLLGGEIVLMTVTDEGGQEFDEYMDRYVLNTKG